MLRHLYAFLSLNDAERAPCTLFCCALRNRYATRTTASCRTPRTAFAGDMFWCTMMKRLVGLLCFNPLIGALNMVYSGCALIVYAGNCGHVPIVTRHMGWLQSNSAV
eukprot:IDg19078t1